MTHSEQSEWTIGMEQSEAKGQRRAQAKGAILKFFLGHPVCVQELLSTWKVSSGKRNICSCVIFANIDIANIHIA